ncbi:MAG UNVERIFIED_CONTAM: hypothetical protein LVT10_20885 [Anaerolineae bacterium]
MRRQILCTLSELDGLQVATAQAILNSEATGLRPEGDRLPNRVGVGSFALNDDSVLTRSLVPFCQNFRTSALGASTCFATSARVS